MCKDKSQIKRRGGFNCNRLHSRSRSSLVMIVLGSKGCPCKRKTPNAQEGCVVRTEVTRSMRLFDRLPSARDACARKEAHPPRLACNKIRAGRKKKAPAGRQRQPTPLLLPALPDPVAAAVGISFPFFARDAMRLGIRERALLGWDNLLQCYC